MKKNKLAFLSIAVLLAVGIMAGTFAYFTQQQTFANLFSTKPYSADTYEHFTSPGDWTPGATTAKQVFAKNTGEGNVIVRVSIPNQEWTSANGASLGLTFGSPAQNAAILNLINTADWVKDGNFYYYQHILTPGQETNSFLDSVTFNKDVPNDAVAVDGSGKTYGETGYDSAAWDAEGHYLGWKDTDGNVHKTYTSSGNGYDGAKYTLNIRIDVLQATKGAMADVWGYDTAASSGGAYTLYNLLTK